MKRIYFGVAAAAFIAASAAPRAQEPQTEVRSAPAAGWTFVPGITLGTMYDSNDEMRRTIDLIDSGFFSDGDRSVFAPLVESLLTRDDYMLLADYQSYVDCQQRASDAYRDVDNWTRMSILNTARTGRFSSDRAIREYCRDIWHIDLAERPASSR